MTNEEILEGNKLIGEFLGMGWVNDSPEDYPNGYYISNNEDTDLPLEVKDWEFHSSWQWLMPVVEKIESLGFWFNIKKNHVTIAWDNKGTTDSNMIHSEFGDQPKIERVFICTIYFIKWYNQQTK